MRTTSKGQLFWRVSALALMSTAGASGAKAAEAGHTWTLELDGTYEFDHEAATQSFIPSDAIPDAYLKPKHGYDVGGRLTYQPDGSPMSYGLAVHFGRTSEVRHSATVAYYSKYLENQSVQNRATTSHAVVDFEVGKDIGLGLFSHDGVATIGGGLRYGHFSSTTRGVFSTTAKYSNSFNTFTQDGTFKLTRTTDAVGPRLFFRTTQPLPGELGRSGLSLGIGADGSVLFGRQRTNNNVESTGAYTTQFPAIHRSRNRTMGTLGAFAQINWHTTGSPLTLSVGYKVDDYINALDGGFQTSHGIDILQHGPFASMIWKLP